MTSQRRLGRGLEALLGRSLEEPAPVQQAPLESESFGGMGINDHLPTRDDQGQQWLDLGVIEPNPYQPRKHFDEVEIADLADSFREHGILQPLVVRRTDTGFQLVAGERRLRAAQAAGWQRVPVQVKNVSDRQTAEIAIVENVQRKDLNAIEKAASFQRYITEYGCTQDELAKRIQVDRSTVANLIRLLDLPESVQQRVIGGTLSQGHARALLTLGDEGEQVRFAERVEREGLSVRATEQAVQNHVHAFDGDLLRLVTPDNMLEDSPAKAPATRSDQIAALEQQLQMLLGAKVALQQNAKGKGRITIFFSSSDEFERIRGMMSSPAQPSSVELFAA